VLFSITITGNAGAGKAIRVDLDKVNDLKAVTGIVESDIWEYNDIFSRIIADHADDIEYLISPTLTRIDGVTLFYDKLCRYIYCLEVIRTHEDAVIVFNNIDPKIAQAIVSRMHGSGRRVRLSDRAALCAHDIMKWLKFLLNIPRTVLLLSFFILASRVFLRQQKGLAIDSAFITYYDYRSTRDGRHREEYFDPLVQWMIKNGQKVAIFNKLLHSNNIRLFFTYLSQIAHTPTGYHNTVNYRYCKLGDIFKSLFFGLVKKPRIEAALAFKGQDITRLTALFLRDDYWNLAWWLNTYLDYHFTTNILKSLRIARIIYPYENHSWEKTVIKARNEVSPSTRLVAFQHTSFSYKLLQYFPGKYERDLPIFPDKILTVGKTLKDELERKGHYPAGLIEEACALRHPYLFSDAGPRGAKTLSRSVAYAFSFDSKNYDTILANLRAVFSDPSYTVYLKFHPDVVDFLNLKESLPSHFVNARKIPWQEVFGKIDILLYDDNSLAIEALKYDVAVVYFALTGQIYNTDRLFGYGSKKIVIDSIEQFREFLGSFYGTPSSARDEAAKTAEYNRRYLLDYFSPINEGVFAKFL